MALSLVLLRFANKFAIIGVTLLVQIDEFYIKQLGSSQIRYCF